MPGMIDQIIHGAVNQPAEALDATMNDEVSGLLNSSLSQLD
jgi:hypothetical protein